MPTSLVTFYRTVFLRHAPRRYAVMQPETADRKYSDYPGQLTDQQISAHLDGRAAYAVPYVAHGLASLLALDIDAGGETAAAALLETASQRGLWAWAQYDPQRGRGYVYIPFDELTHAGRIHTLGQQLLASASRPAWKIENRATDEDTRLPFARHTWTGRRGMLLYQDGSTADLDTPDRYHVILTDFANHYRENPTDTLPPAPQPQERSQKQNNYGNYRNYGIAHYNTATDLTTLLEHYGAHAARGRGARLYFCPFHSDAHASLLIARDGTTCHCLSQGSGCALAERQHDAFNVFCIGEQLSNAQALRRLNGHPDDGTPPKTPPAAPGGARHIQDSPTTTPRPKTPRKATSSAETIPAATTPPADRFRACAATAEAPTTATNGRRLPKTCRRILAAIRAEGGHYWRGVPQLARLLDCDPRTVQRSLRRLEAEGLLCRQQRGRDGHTDIYQEGGRHLPPTLGHESTSTETLGADKGGQPDAPPPAEATTRPSSQADADGAHHGPAGAIAYPGGAAYVPPEAAHWYASLQAGTPPERTEEHPSQAEPIQAEIVSYEPEPPTTPAPRRRRRSTGATDPARLAGRIIAAERRAANLERTGKARDRQQARAIRRSVEQLRAQLARIEADQREHYYTPDECDQWQAEHQAKQGAASAPPYQLIEREIPDAQAMIARLRARRQDGDAEGLRGQPLAPASGIPNLPRLRLVQAG